MDGYTLLIRGNPLGSNQFLFKTIGYAPVPIGNLIRLAGITESGDVRSDDRFYQIAGKRAGWAVPLESTP